MKNPFRKPGSIFLVLFIVLMGARLVLSFFLKPKPIVLPPLVVHDLPSGPLPLPVPEISQSTVSQEELAEVGRKLEELSKPPAERPAPVATPPPPPPPPAFRASRPGADQFQPLAFPPNVTEPYTPEGFKKHLESALKECPMGAMEVVSLDCSEFPCMALTELKDETARQANLNSCMPWIDIYSGGTQYVSVVGKREGREVHYTSWVPLPPHPADAKLVMLRSTRRTKAMVKALSSK